MVKAVLKDVVLAIVVIAVQVAMNIVNAKEHDWVTIILVGIALGVIDFSVTYFKGQLERVNYNIKGITREKKNHKKNKRM